uniref:non-specific serine/threonine protein kinase n=1 Tax=Noccaea caerulescens TaxID=107243 RepID=A0A1J3FDN3_NOCCA
MRSMRLFLLLPFSALMLLELELEGYGFTGETDKQGLLEFKSGVSENGRVVLSSWNHSIPLCNWEWVTCGRKHKRVTRLDLGDLQLGGVISPYIGNLSFLVWLDLGNNSFVGTIPQELGNLFRLNELSMYSNLLGGAIPARLSNCSRLLGLSVDSNRLGEGIPSELGSLTQLTGLYLGSNNLKGKLPASFGNLTSLELLDFSSNNLEGGIPDDLARLAQMVNFDARGNHFSGVFPPAIYNLSSLKFLYMTDNGFSGSLRPDFGSLLPNLEWLYLRGNNFTGPIPATLPNISTLQRLDLQGNNLIGSIPVSFGKAWRLQYLGLFGNSLGSNSFGDLEFLGALSNCTNLQRLSVGENRLGGDLPTSIANLSRNLIGLDLSANFISGSIPHEIGNLISLQRLILYGNRLTGTLPTTLGKLSDLGVIDVSSNRMSGEIPSAIGNITRLVTLYLYNNIFEGTFPLSLSNCSYLLKLDVGSNKLKGAIPVEIMQMSSLIYLGMSGNSFTGSLPKDVGKSLVRLSLAHNKLSGQLPQTLGKCLSMEYLYLQGNLFDGSIPDLSGLVDVKAIDLSSNSLFGSIPGYLANLSKLQYLNLSVNNLEGEVPTEGIFQNASIVSVFGNTKLCGGIKQLQLKPCLTRHQPQTVGTTKHSSLFKKVVIGVSIGIALILLFLLALVSLRWLTNRKKNQQANHQAPSALEVLHERISYGDIRNATDGFSSINLIGTGSFGTVFKALLPAENKVVAVKVLNMQRRGAMKSFMAECESLKDIRHRNLVKLLTACSSTDFQGNDFRALIYEFMPNGSLDVWLHPEEAEEIQRPSRTLTLFERLNIAIDVAYVLDYLHVHCHDPIAHCDLKPSNVLLDDDMIAHVSDFGLSRLLLKYDKDSFLNRLSSGGVRGTIGYAAPEYGMGGKPSREGDFYSFGVLLLEMFTGKRPTDELFVEESTLHSYTESGLQEHVLDIADISILQGEVGNKNMSTIAECLKMVFHVGMRCCEESPTNRMTMAQALAELVSIRKSFLSSQRTRDCRRSRDL